MANHMQAALEKAKANQGKTKKSKYGKRREDQMPASMAGVVNSGDQSEGPVVETPIAADAPATSPATLEPEKAKKAKKVSGQVSRWKAQKAFPLEAKITEVRKENPKRKSAAGRFALYEEGMTVGDYIKKSNEAGNTKALAMADIRWDHVAGFITVVA